MHIVILLNNCSYCFATLTPTHHTGPLLPRRYSCPICAHAWSHLATSATPATPTSSVSVHTEVHIKLAMISQYQKPPFWSLLPTPLPPAYCLLYPPPALSSGKLSPYHCFSTSALLSHPLPRLLPSPPPALYLLSHLSSLLPTSFTMLTMLAANIPGNRQEKFLLFSFLFFVEANRR